MSGFKLEGGPARGGKMADLVREARAHEMLRREAALRATADHIGVSIDELAAPSWGPQRVQVVHSIPPMPAFRTLRPVSDDIIPLHDRFVVELDGRPVWRGWWEWSQYAAQWREESLTDWMRASLAQKSEATS